MLFSRSLLVLALSLALILIGVNSQSGWLFWLAGMLIAAMLVAWTVSLFEVRGLSLRRHHRAEISEDGLLQVDLEVRNRGRFSRILIEVLDGDPAEGWSRRRPRLKPARKTLREHIRDPAPAERESPATRGGSAAFLVPRIGAGGEVRISYRRGGLRRGVYEDWPGFFYSEGVIGLARHSSRARPRSRLVVLPRYEELGSFPLVDSFLQTLRTPLEYSGRKGAGVDYYGVREFRPGDPLRHVHWKTTARRGELVVREFEREAGTPLVVLVDNRVRRERGREYSSLLDAEARLAASVAHYAHYAGHPVTLAAYAGETPELYDVPGFRAALRWLAALRPSGGSGLEEQAEGLWPELNPGCFFCCITPARSLDPARLGAALPHMCPTALVLVDPISHGGNGSPRGGNGMSPEQVVSRLARAPFPGLFSVSLYREGEDVRKCLEKPSIIFDDLMPPGR